MQYAKRTFNGGINTDADPRFVAEGDYTYAVNVTNTSSIGGKIGTLQSIRGNVLNQCIDLPLGNNKVVGAHSNAQRKSIIVFVSNDQGNDCIYEFIPFSKDSNSKRISFKEACEKKFEDVCMGNCCKLLQCDMKFGNKIHSVDFVDGDLMYWTDGDIGEGLNREWSGNPPRKLNLKKANNCDKCKEYELAWLGGAEELITEVNIVVADDGIGKSVAAYQISITNSGELFEVLGVANEHITIKQCKDCIEIKTKEGFSISVTSDHSFLIPKNHYIGCPDLKRQLFPPSRPPTTRFINDLTKSEDRISGRAIQFATQYIFCDGEQSDWSDPSSIAVPPTNSCVSCNVNCIEIDYTDQRLLEANSGIIGINFAYREGNNGQWYQFEHIKRCQIGDQKLCFYGNKISRAVTNDDIIAEKNLTPEISLSQRFMDGRLIDAGVKEGRNALDCTDMSTRLLWEDRDSCQPEDEELWTIEGDIQIWQVLSRGRREYVNQQPIYDNGDEAYPVFGGLGRFGAATYEADTGSRYQQFLPEGGFVVYLKGTDHFGISVQKQIGLATTGNGVLNGQSGSQRNDIRDKIQDNVGLCSSFKIEGVKPGCYEISVASHWVSYGDKLGKGAIYDLNGDEWQNTSTYLITMGGEFGNTPSGSNAPGSTKKLNLGSGGGTLTLEPTVIADLTIPSLLGGVFDNNKSVSQQGYLLDGCGSKQIDDLGIAPRMEKQCFKWKQFDFELIIPPLLVPQVPFGVPLPLFNTIYNIISNIFRDKTGYTDHNGFFFFAYNESLLGGTSIVRAEFEAINGTIIKEFNEQFYQDYSLQSLYDGDAAGDNNKDFKTSQGLHENIVYPSQDIKKNIRTYVRGRLVDQNGCGVIGVNVGITGTNRCEPTDQNGCFNILIYGDNCRDNNGRPFDSLYFSYSGSCCVVIPQCCVPIDINNIGEDDYNEENPFDVEAIVIGVTNEPISRSYKTGGVYETGIKYEFDCGTDLIVRGPQICVPALDEIKEDKVPYLEVFIDHEPPEGAVRWKPLISKNLAQIACFNWMLGKVEYSTGECQTVEGETTASLVETTYSNGDAKYIQLCLCNLDIIKCIETDYQVLYDYKVGDRIRFIKDSDGEYFDLPKSTETRIEGILDNGCLVIGNIETLPELKAGTLIEVCREAIEVENNLLFTTGQCYDIVDGKHMANIQNQGQEPIFGKLLPAIMRYEGGDTFLRRRTLPLGCLDDPMPGQVTRIIEDAYISDTSQIEAADIGRAYYPNEGNKRICDGNLIRYSGKHFSGTEINGLSSNRPLDRVETSIDFGPVRFIVNLGNQGVFIHENKLVSFYMGEGAPVFVDGTTLIARTDRVININWTYVQDWGTQHPESIEIHDSFIYGFDLQQCVPWRRSQNGLVDLSKYVFENEIQRLCGKYQKEDVCIQSGYDPDSDTWILRFVGENCSDTVAFAQETNRWTASSLQYESEWFQTMNGVLFSFRNGMPVIHNSNPTLNSLYGETQTSIVRFPFNHLPTVQKRFKKIRVDLDGEIKMVKLSIPSGKDSKKGRISRIKKNNFSISAGKCVAEILRDMNDPRYKMPEALFRGRRMEGTFMMIEIEFIGSLFAVDVGWEALEEGFV